MNIKRGLQSTEGTETNFRVKKETRYDRMTCSEINQAAYLSEYGRGNDPLLIADRETWNWLVNF